MRCFYGTKAPAVNHKVGLMLGKWRELQPNIELALRQQVG